MKVLCGQLENKGRECEIEIVITDFHRTRHFQNFTAKTVQNWRPFGSKTTVSQLKLAGKKIKGDTFE